MPANFGLPALSLLASYVLRIFVAYFAVRALACLTTRANLRFVLWISYLVCAGAYWVLLLRQFGRVVNVGAMAGAASGAALAAHLPGAAWNVSLHWAAGIAIGMRFAAAAYGLSTLILLGLALRKRLRLHRLLSHATRVTGILARDFEYLGRSLGVRQCSLWTLEGLESPATVFSFRPRVLLPGSIERALDDEQLNDVLCHELLHVRRRDYAWGALAELVRCLLFFHPAVWLAIANLRRERELACDAAVVRQRANRTPDYAQCLTRMARLRLAAPESAFSTNLVAAESLLRLRVRTLLAETARVPLWKRSAAFTCGLGVLATLAMIWPLLAVVLRARPAPAATPVFVARKAQTPKPGPARRSLSPSSRPGNSRSDRGPSVESQSITLPPPPHLTLEAANANFSGAYALLQGATQNRQTKGNSPEDPTSPENRDPDRAGVPVWNKSKAPGAAATRPDWSRIAVGVAIAAGRAAAAGGGASGGGGNQSGNN